MPSPRLPVIIYAYVTFFEEAFSLDLLEELYPLINDHYLEVGSFPEIPLDVDAEAYQGLYNMGILRVFTIRCEARKLKGYASFHVSPSLHSKMSINATCDGIYVLPEARGKTGGSFIAWIDDKFRREGVSIIHHFVKRTHDYSLALERLGYTHTENIYSRVLTGSELGE